MMSWAKRIYKKSRRFLAPSLYIHDGAYTQGFTLIELLIALFIFSILTGFISISLKVLLTANKKPTSKRKLSRIQH